MRRNPALFTTGLLVVLGKILVGRLVFAQLTPNRNAYFRDC